MSNRLARFSTLRHKLFNNTSPKNLKLFALHLCHLHVSKMDDVSKAAKGWSNPGVSNIYEKTRPNYNLDSVEFLLEKVGAFEVHQGPEPFTIVELGAGTGKFTRAMLKVLEKRKVENFKVISTEPLKEMCDKFKEMVPNVEILQRPASNLDGFLSNSVDAILAAHCFHWFYTDQKAIEEIHRVLKSKGTLGLIWNVPDRSVSWIKEIEEMLDPRFTKILKIPNPYDEVLFTHLHQHGGFGNDGKDVTSYEYSMEMTLMNVIERYKGISVVSAAQGIEKEQILQAIEQIMKKGETANNKKYIYSFVVKMHWLQKTSS